MLIIMATNLQMYYWGIKMGYTKLLIITKLIFIGIEIKVLREINYTYDNSIKPKR